MKRATAVCALFLAACGGTGDPAAPQNPPPENLAGLLQDENPTVRARAAREMGRDQSFAFAPALIEALSDSKYEVRVEAIFALGQLAFSEAWKAGQESAIAPRLLALFPVQDFAEHAAVVEALGKLGGDGVEARIALMALHPDPDVRAETALALFRLRQLKRIAAYSPESTEALCKLMDDENDEVRWRAVYAFSRWPEPKAADRLVKALASPNRWERIFAARALGQLKDAPPLDALARAAADPDELVRVDAVNAFGKLSRADAMPPSVFADKSAHVRAAAARAIGSTPKAELQPKLDVLLRDPSTMVRAEAIAAAAPVRGEDFATEILAQIRSPEWTVRAAAFRAAGELPERGLKIILQGLGETDVRVASAALEALGKKKIVAPEAEAWIKSFLRSDKAGLEMRGTAVDAAKERGAEKFLPDLVACYRNSLGRNFVEVREGLVDAVATLKTPEAKEFLQEAMRDLAPSVRNKAAKALELACEPPPRPDVSRFVGRAPASATVVLETDKGEIEIECFPGDAPVHVAGFLERVRAKTYDDTIWHRVVSNFVIQGGDPRGTGWGDAGYFLRDEINRRRFDRGAVGMPKAGKDTGGCQLFITHTPTPHLDGRYTVFGAVTRGMDVVDKIEPGDRILKARVK